MADDLKKQAAAINSNSEKKNEEKKEQAKQSKDEKAALKAAFDNKKKSAAKSDGASDNSGESEITTPDESSIVFFDNVARPAEGDAKHFFYIKNIRTNEALFSDYLPINQFQYSKSAQWNTQSPLKRSSPVQSFTGSDAVSYSFSFDVNPILAGSQWWMIRYGGKDEKKVNPTIAEMHAFFRQLAFPYYVGGYVKGPLVSITCGPLLNRKCYVTQISADYGDSYYNYMVPSDTKKPFYPQLQWDAQVIKLTKVSFTLSVTEIEDNPSFAQIGTGLIEERQDYGYQNLLRALDANNAVGGFDAEEGSRDDMLAELVSIHLWFAGTSLNYKGTRGQAFAVFWDGDAQDVKDGGTYGNFQRNLKTWAFGQNRSVDANVIKVENKYWFSKDGGNSPHKCNVGVGVEGDTPGSQQAINLATSLCLQFQEDYYEMDWDLSLLKPYLNVKACDVRRALKKFYDSNEEFRQLCKSGSPATFDFSKTQGTNIKVHLCLGTKNNKLWAHGEVSKRILDEGQSQKLADILKQLSQVPELIDKVSQLELQAQENSKKEDSVKE